MRRFVRFHGSLRAVLVLGSALAVFGGWELAAPIRGQIVRAAGRPPRGRYPWRSPCRDALHDANLDKYIQPFRDCFPVVANELTPSSDPSESVAASNVVAGVALRNAFDQGAFAAGQNWGPNLPPPAPIRPVS